MNRCGFVFYCYSRFSRSLSLNVSFPQAMKLSFVRIDGTVPGSERQRRIDAFNDPGTPPPTVSPTTPPTVGTPTVSPTAPPTVGSRLQGGSSGAPRSEQGARAGARGRDVSD